MQRLFSMFPAGAAGWGLVLIRVCAAGMLLRNSTAHATALFAYWELAGIFMVAGAFCLGAFTPVICSISAAVQVLIMLCTSKPDTFQLGFSLCVTAALFLLGPGAFSLDSRLFGRRLIVHSNSE